MKSFILSSKQLFAVLLFLTAIFAAACGSSASRAESSGDRSGADSEQPSQAPVSVTTTRAVAREVPSFVQATGSLVAEEISDVSPQISGQIIATPVNVGAFVKQGDVLARLDDRDARLRLRQAELAVRQTETGVRQAEARLGLGSGGSFNASTIPEVQAANANLEQSLAELRQAETNEKRYRELVETGDVSIQVYEGYRTQRDTARARVNNAKQQQEAAVNTARQSNQAIQAAQAEVESARANVAVAQKAVADATIRSPYTGFVSNRPIAVGEYVTPSSVIATILRTSTLRLQLQVPEAEAPFINQGMNVSLEVDAFKDRKFAGTVTAVNPAIDQASRAATVEAAVPNSENLLRAGMFATARIFRQGGNNGVFVPRAAIQNDPNTQSYRAFVIQDNIARLRVVQLGAAEENDLVQIASGINADEVLAISNLPQLYEGAPVQLQ